MSFVRPIPLQKKNSSDINSVFKPMDEFGLGERCYFLRIVNDSDKAIEISFDGFEMNEYIPAGKQIEIPGAIYSNPQVRQAVWPKATKIYIRGQKGTGLITVSGYYQEF